MTPTRTLLLPLAAAALLVTAGCSSSHTSSTAAPASSSGASSSAAGAPSTGSAGTAAPAAAATITIHDFMYDMPASVPAGATVTVVNQDSEAHTVTLGSGAAKRVVVKGRASATISVPTAAGHYPVTCDFHGNMHADLVVA